MMKKIVGVLSVFALTLGHVYAQSTEYPVTLENCSETLHFSAQPQRVVSVGQAATEILYSLGLGQSVVGTGVWFTEVLPEFAELNQNVKKLADNDPSFEAIAQQRPDLVAVEYAWHIGEKGSIGTRKQFSDIGMPTYLMPSDCVHKDNTVGLDGTRSQLFSMDGIYQSIHELGLIFDHQSQAEALVSSLKARERQAIDKAAAVKTNGLSAVFWFSSTKINSDPFVAGQKGAPAYMLKQLNIKNVIDSDEEWPVAGWETIAKQNPTLIVLAKMKRRRYEGDDIEKKIAFLKNDPVTREMDAVKHDRIVIMDAHTMDPSIRTVNGIEQIAEALKTFKLTQ